MKKTLLAIAALAATSGAFAQSNVTLYGVIDASVENIDGNHSVTRISSDNLATSRLGFKGSEDLGGGLRANFALETNVKVDNGATNPGGAAGRFFDRAAWAGVQGGFGELRLGRIDSSIGALAGDTNILGAQAYDDFKIARTRAGDSYRRVDNAVTYLLPTFVEGFSAQLQYSTTANSGAAVLVANTAPVNAENTSGSDIGKSAGFHIKYTGGPLQAGVGYLYAKDETSFIGIPAAANTGNGFAGNQNNKGNAALAFVAYDFKVLKLTGYYDTESKVFGADRLSLAGIRVGVPITANFSVQASASYAKNVANRPSDSDHDDAVITSVKAVYTLSKRTALYGLFTNVNNESNAQLSIDGSTRNATLQPTRGQTDRGIAFGIRHTF